MRLEARPARTPFEQPRLRVESAQRRERLTRAEMRSLDCALEHTERRVVDLERYRKWMTVLAAVGEREACGIGKARGCPVHDLGDECERSDGPRSHPRLQ